MNGDSRAWQILGGRHRELPRDAEFSRVRAHRLTIRGVICSGTGTYRWTIIEDVPRLGQLKLKKIHDACKLRVNLLTGTWSRPG